MRNARRHNVLFAILIGAFSLVLTNSSFNILLPNIIEMYNISTTYGGWIIIIYLLAMTVTMPLTGSIVDLLGKKTTYLIGIGLYGLFSIVGGVLSHSVHVVMFVRFMHGVSAGLMIPLSLVLLFDIYKKEVRGKVTGVWGMLLTIAPAVGPTFGGLIIQYGSLAHLFWFNVPFAFISLFLCFKKIKGDRPARKKQIRVQHIIQMMIGIGSLCIGIQLVSNSDIPLWFTCVVILIGLYVLILFIKKDSAQKEQLIRFMLLKNRVYALSVIITAIQAAAIFGVIFIFPLLFQEIYGLSPTITGALFIPTAIFTSMFVWIGGNFLDTGKSIHFILFGVGLIIGSILMFVWVPQEVSLLFIIVMMSIRGVGIGLSNMTVITIGLNSLSNDYLHEGSALSNTIKRLVSSITMMALTGYYEIRWQMLQRMGESVLDSKWKALREECLILSGLMMLALLLVGLLIKERKNEDVENRK